ncbi:MULTISPECIES: T9SS type A sorting domain-containing protein [Chitinophagaceae]
MKKIITPLFSLFLMATGRTVFAQNLTRFYLQDFGKASYYNPSNTFTSYYSTTTGNNSIYSYNAIFNAGTASGVTAAKLVPNPPTSFTSYGLVAPATQPQDGNLSIVQHVGTSANGATFSSSGWNSVSFWDHTTGGTSNTGSTTNPTPDGMFLFVNADPTHIGVTGGTYFELPLQVLNIPGATYAASLWWRDMDGNVTYSNVPTPAFVGVDVNTGPKGSGQSLAYVKNPASNLSTNATTTQKKNAADRATVSTAWQQLTLPTFTLSQSFTGDVLYFNVYNSDPGFNNTNGNDIAVDDIELSMQTISSLSGKVYDDGTSTGSTTTTFDGSVTPLYAVLLDANGKVVQTVPVGSDGSYSFITNQANNQFIPYATGNIGLRIVLSTTNLPVGTANVNEQTILSGLATTGKNTPGSNTFTSDKLNKGIALQSTSADNITGANLYVDYRPIAASLSNTLTYQPQVGDKIPILLTGTDKEDGSTDITHTSGGTTVTIGMLPTNGQLLYGNNLIIAGQTITGFDLSKLMLELTGSGYSSTSFTYAFTDKAGIESTPATYTLTIPYALPVQLQSFIVTLQNGLPYLQWTTATEINNAGFNIQRSTDGQNWTTIGHKASTAQNGNSNIPISYDFTDNTLINGKDYYRLLQVDHDGKVSPSTVQSISVSGTQTTLKVFPNPAIDYIDVANVPIGNVLRIVGIDGKVYQTVIVSNSIQRVSLSGYAPGLYLVQIQGKGNTLQSYKFLKK